MLRRETHCLGKEHTLLRPQLKLPGRVLLIAIVKVSGQAQIDPLEVDKSAFCPKTKN